MKEHIDITKEILSHKESLIQGLGKMYYEEKIHEAKWYLLKMKRELNHTDDFTYVVYEKINWNNENYNNLLKEELPIENMLWLIAGIELDNEINK